VKDAPAAEAEARYLIVGFDGGRPTRVIVADFACSWVECVRAQQPQVVRLARYAHRRHAKKDAHGHAADPPPAPAEFQLALDGKVERFMLDGADKSQASCLHCGHAMAPLRAS
jgi:hypothetical protein